MRTGSKPNSLRVATWNIERGLEFDAVRAALTNEQRFFRRLRSATRPTNFDLNAVLEQARRLSHADMSYTTKWIGVSSGQTIGMLRGISRSRQALLDFLDERYR